jgi:hypothetical protein
MKIALLLTGFIRQHSRCYESIIKHIINKYNVDVYFATWDKTQSYINTELVVSDYTGLMNIYDIKGYVVLNYDHYIQNKVPIQFQSRLNDIFLTDSRAREHGSFWVERLRDQWYLIKEGFLSIPYIYDTIIRLRFDIKLHNFSIQSNNFTIPKPNHSNPYNDHIAYGSVDSMRKYCFLYDFINKMYIEDNVDISFAELMLKYYMENMEPKIKTHINTDISYEILK